jgi:hypothetical protein
MTIKLETDFLNYITVLLYIGHICHYYCQQIATDNPHATFENRDDDERIE